MKVGEIIMEDDNITDPSSLDGNDPEVDATPDGEVDTTGKDRSAETRIQELIAKNKTLEERLNKVDARLTPPVPRVNDDIELTPEMERAFKILEKGGFVKKDYVESQLKGIQDRTVLDGAHTKFANSYDGSDGRPKYDQDEVEKYMRDHGQWEPEIAYKMLHEDELLDWNLKKLEAGRGKKPFVQKGGSTAGADRDAGITREKIAEWLKTPEGKVKYEQNRDKIRDMMTKGQL